jgi:muramoyltetrapeptide carboxypeptidase LdcA involved in peptidoglycan recycling
MVVRSEESQFFRQPILADVDFGHTFPMITFPIGGKMSLVASRSGSKLEIIEH